MSAFVLHLDKRVCTLELKAEVLVATDANGQAMRVPLRQLASVVVNGGTQAAGRVWAGLAAAGVAVVICAQGRLDQATLAFSGPLPATVRLRVLQHQAADQPARKLAMARRIVEAKLDAMAACRQVLGAGLNTALCPFAPIAARIPLCSSTDSLRGLEGHASAGWFDQLRLHIAPRWKFSTRNRRPPMDPVNALLSFYYTLATSEALQACQLLNFDPALGFLHEPWPGRFALALDVVEAARPGCDLFVLGLLDRVLQPEQFSSSAANGCRLNREAMQLFMAEWARNRLAWPARNGSLRQLLHEQLRQCALALGAEALPKEFEPAEEDRHGPVA